MHCIHLVGIIKTLFFSVDRLKIKIKSICSYKKNMQRYYNEDNLRN